MQSRYRAPFGEGGSTPVTREFAARMLTEALSRGGDYADLFFEYEVTGGYSFEEGILRSASRAVSAGVGVRAMKGDSTGYAYAESFDGHAMLRAARTAAQIANAVVGIAPKVLGIRQPPERYPIDVLSFNVDGPEKRALLELADKTARAADPRVVRVSASFSESLREIIIATSTGAWVRDRQPLVRFGVNVIIEKDGRRETGSSGGGGRLGLEYFHSRSPEWHAKQAVRQAATMLDARDAPAGELEVVLAPGDSGVLLHEAVGHGLEADFNRKGTSNYSGRIGERVASELCTVVDDATVLFSRGSINVDDEANTPGHVVLIEKGVLRGYMQDRHSAEHFATQSTGHGRRESFRAPPMPRMTNTMLLGGADDPEEIVQSVKRGVYARKFGGGQVDISNGDFVFSLTESYLIEDGRITAPLKGVNLIGNGPDAMRKVVALGADMELSDGIWTCGKDGQSVPVGVACPTVKISSITVGGTQIG